MADQTIIANMAASSVQPRDIVAGVQSVISVYSLSRTLSASDKIYMCKIPDGARVLGVNLQFNVNPFADAGVVNVGTPADATKFIMSVTPSAGLLFSINSPNGLGYLNDISDSAAQRFTYVQVSVSTAMTGTQSGAISLVVTYQMDQPNVT